MTKLKTEQGDELTADLLTQDQAAHYLYTTTDTLRAWIKDKKIAYYQLGARKMFRTSDLDAFLEGCRINAE